MQDGVCLTLSLYDWNAPVTMAEQAVGALESGKPIVPPNLPFAMRAQERTRRPLRTSRLAVSPDVARAFATARVFERLSVSAMAGDRVTTK